MVVEVVFSIQPSDVSSSLWPFTMAISDASSLSVNYGNYNVDRIGANQRAGDGGAVRCRAK